MRTEPIPLVIVGCGRIVELGHAPALCESTDFHVIGLVDPASQCRERISDLLGGGVPQFADLESAPIRAAAVLLTTPPTMRLGTGSSAIEAGARALLVEKPVGESGSAAGSLLKLARTSGCHLLPVHNHLFEASFARVIRMATEGTLGRLQQIELTHRMTEVFSGAWPGHELWRSQLAAGCLGDLGYHALYLIQSIVADAIAEGSCDARWTASSEPTIEAARAELRHRGGIRSQLMVSWSAPSASHELRIAGTAGTAWAFDDGSAHLQTADASSSYLDEAGLVRMYQAWYGWAARLIDRTPDYRAAAGAVRASQLLDRLVDSARQAGAPIAISEG